MAQQQIITKPYVEELQDNDSLFINHDGALRQIKKGDADFASGADMRAEVAAREAFEAQEVAAREAFEKSETEARGQFETSVEGQIAEKANVDGYYEEMTVGDAEQLVATQFVEDNEPYLFRSTGGSSDVGNRAYLDKIVGGTVAWNQLAKEPNRASGTFAGLTYTNNGDGSFTTNGTATTTDFYTIATNTDVPVSGHKYVVTGCNKTGGTGNYWIGFGGNNHDDSGNGAIVNNTNRPNTSVTFAFTSGATFNNVTFKPQLFDLTQMFGSTIADYIYSLEQSQAGAGVAWFKKLFPNDYYAYNAGELLSVEGLQSHDTVGFNQWDEEWELGSYDTTTGEPSASSSQIRCKNYIPIVPNASYYFAGLTSGNMRPLYYDADKNFIGVGYWQGGTSNNPQTTPANAHYMRFYLASTEGTAYKGNLCLNLSWSGYRNGEYEPYEKHSYPLDSSLTLRGIPKLDASNNLYYDGDEYTSDGKVKRKYGIVVLNGSEPSWTKSSSALNGFYINMATGAWIPPNGYMKGYAHVIALGYTYTDNVEMYYGHYGYVLTDYTIAFNIDPAICGSTVEEFKAWLAQNPITVVYELATPTTETAEPYQFTQIIDDFGTEEFVSNGFVPAGHVTRYPANLRDKLQHLPDLASVDGTYLIQQLGKQMSLVYMPAIFPEIPTEDGTYTLKTVVTGGVATLQWVAE